MMHTLVVSKSKHVSLISSYKICAGCVVFAFLLINELNCARLPWSQDVIVQSKNNPWNSNEFWYKFKTLFGTSGSENDTLKTSGNGQPYIDVKGKIANPIAGYVKDVHYKANDKGFDILHRSVQRDTRILPRMQGENVIIANNTTDTPEDDKLSYKIRTVPPDVLATLLGGG